jgi:hypothetical protein
MQALVLLSSAAVGGLASVPSVVSSVAPVPELAFILQVAAAGTAIGSAVALRAKRRNPDADTWAITTAWATLGLLCGGLAVLISVLA